MAAPADRLRFERGDVRRGGAEDEPAFLGPLDDVAAEADVTAFVAVQQLEHSRAAVGTGRRGNGEQAADGATMAVGVRHAGAGGVGACPHAADHPDEQVGPQRN